jgi:hypothetical protein
MLRTKHNPDSDEKANKQRIFIHRSAESVGARLQTVIDPRSNLFPERPDFTALCKLRLGRALYQSSTVFADPRWMKLCPIGVPSGSERFLLDEWESMKACRLTIPMQFLSRVRLQSHRKPLNMREMGL